jgi:hypothetical protein
VVNRGCEHRQADGHVDTRIDAQRLDRPVRSGGPWLNHDPSRAPHGRRRGEAPDTAPVGLGDPSPYTLRRRVGAISRTTDDQSTDRGECAA